MPPYYTEKLSAERLKHVYDIAPPRIRQYLDAELDHVVEKIKPGDLVLELGCGYGRIIPQLAQKAGSVFGIDTSLDSLRLAKKTPSDIPNCDLLCMDAATLGFPNNVFDMVVCIQNGISAFHVDQKELIAESVRVARPRGKILFSSYSEKFWEDRLKWFELQSEAGLLGEIDYAKTGDGVIVCRDGFTATTVSAHQFLLLTQDFSAETKITEVDGSSLFCEITLI